MAKKKKRASYPDASTEEAPVVCDETVAFAFGGGMPALGELSDTIRVLKKGLPFRAFESVREMIGVSAKELTKVIHIAARTLARRREEGRLLTDESDRLMRVARLFKLAVELTGDSERARRWFTSPKRALGGHSPLEYADTEPGAREVEDLIGRLEHGVFS